MRHWVYTEQVNVCTECSFETFSLSKFRRHTKHCVSSKQPVVCLPASLKQNSRKRKSEEETPGEVVSKQRRTSNATSGPVGSHPQIKKKTSTKKYICDKCPFSGMNTDQYMQHRQCHVEKNGAFKCKHCPFWVMVKSKLIQHSKLHAAMNETYIQFHHVEDDLVPGSGRRCDFTMNSLESNPPQCHTDLQCLYCSYTVASVTLMRQHTVSHVSCTEAVKTILFSESLKELLSNDNDAAAVAASDSTTCSNEDSPDTGSEQFTYSKVICKNYKSADINCIPGISQLQFANCLGLQLRTI